MKLFSICSNSPFLADTYKSRYSFPKYLDKIFDAQKGEVDKNKRKSLVHKFEKTALENAIQDQSYSGSNLFSRYTSTIGTGIYQDMSAAAITGRACPVEETLHH